jgi:hypothetical protein
VLVHSSWAETPLLLERKIPLGAVHYEPAQDLVPRRDALAGARGPQKECQGNGQVSKIDELGKINLKHRPIEKFRYESSYDNRTPSLRSDNARAPLTAWSYRQANKAEAVLDGELGVIESTRSWLHLIPVQKMKKINLRKHALKYQRPQLEGRHVLLTKGTGQQP